MNKESYTLLVVEPSHLIFEGLCNIVSKQDYNWDVNRRTTECGLCGIISRKKYNINILRVTSFDELMPVDHFLKVSYDYSNQKREIDLIIINTFFAQIREKDFKKLQKNLPNAYWIGMQTSLTDGDLMKNFNTVFSIYSSPDEISSIIEKAISFNSVGRRGRENQESLSSREKDVLIEMIKGLSNKEIADHLNISIHTVISHRKNITFKTGIKSQSGLTLYAISQKIITIDDPVFNFEMKTQQ